MTFTLFDFIYLLGSLGLFLFGMKIMSEGIQKAAGDRMRQILSAMTSRRVLGPVSYTHLDVYKRQSSPRLERLLVAPSDACRLGRSPVHPL